MPRKSMVELEAEATTNLPDNTSGAISAADVRQMFLDFINAIRPAYGVLQKTAPQTVNLGTTDVSFVYTTATSSDINQLTASAATGKISRTERGTSSINFTMDIECATNRFITFTLYKNGAATPWRMTVNGAGTGKPTAVSMTAIDYADPAAEYEVRAMADTAATSTILSNGSLILGVDPVNSYT